MNFCLTEEQQLLRRTVREFSEAEIKPHIREWDEAQQFPRELLAKLADLGLMGIQFAPEYGGSGMSAIDYCICIEELARVDPSVSLSVAAHNGLGAAHIGFFGSEAQKQKYLTPLARGEKLAAWGLTEPNSGSDAAAMRTTATRDGDAWVLNGIEDVHHARQVGRHDGRDGGHRQEQGQQGHLRVRRRARHAGFQRRQEGRQARHARQRDDRSDLPELPHSSAIS